MKSGGPDSLNRSWESYRGFQCCSANQLNMKERVIFDEDLNEYRIDIAFTYSKSFMNAIMYSQFICIATFCQYSLIVFIIELVFWKGSWQGPHSLYNRYRLDHLEGCLIWGVLGRRWSQQPVLGNPVAKHACKNSGGNNFKYYALSEYKNIKFV